MSDDLDQILSGEESPKIENNEQVETQEDVNNNKPQEKNEEVVEDLQLETGEKEEEETPTSTEDNQESWTKKAVLDERRKRQELEKEIQNLKALTQEKQIVDSNEPEAKRPDIYEDQDGAFKFMEQTFEKKMWEQKVALSRDLLSEKYEDYEEMEKSFLDMAKDNPILSQQLRASNNPARFAYETAKNHLESQKFSDPNYRESLKEEIRKEVLAEMVEQNNLQPEKPKVTVPNLTNATSAKSGDKFPSDQSLEDLMPE